MEPNLNSTVAVIMALELESQGVFEAAGHRVFYSGMGKVNAAFTAASVIHQTGCRHLINLGTAGSHRFNTHSLVECSGFVQRDMDLTPLGFKRGQTPFDDIEGMIEGTAAMTNLPRGICGTGDSFEIGAPQVACDLVDMEAFAIAKVCRRMNVTFTSIKYITDGADPEASKDWEANLVPASQSLFKVYSQLTAAPSA